MKQITFRFALAALGALTLAGALVLAVITLGSLWLNSVLAVVTNGATMIPALHIVLAGLGTIALGVISILSFQALAKEVRV